MQQPTAEVANESVIRRFLGSLSDLDQAKTLVDPEARFIAVREQFDETLPLYGTFVGHDGLVDFVGGLRAHFDTRMFTVDAVIETDELGFAAGRFEHRIRATDRLFRSHWSVLCAFRNGRITLYRFFEDTAALEEAMGVHTLCRESVSLAGVTS